MAPYLDNICGLYSKEPFSNGFLLSTKFITRLNPAAPVISVVFINIFFDFEEESLDEYDDSLNPPLILDEDMLLALLLLGILNFVVKFSLFLLNEKDDSWFVGIISPDFFCDDTDDASLDNDTGFSTGL
uniref:Transmembrane protein n=1 Tax=viral metagenome TaxID=1070528 RepID=A0A6C0DFX2_9ZZZZ